MFCDRLERSEYIEELSLTGLQAVFEPLNPVTPGHLLVVPWEHVAHAAVSPSVTGRVTEHAARTVARFGYNANIITSIGPNATQTVYHLHIHIVPRNRNDGLQLPW